MFPGIGLSRSHAPVAAVHPADNEPAVVAGCLLPSEVAGVEGNNQYPDDLLPNSEIPHWPRPSRSSTPTPGFGAPRPEAEAHATVLVVARRAPSCSPVLSAASSRWKPSSAFLRHGLRAHAVAFELASPEAAGHGRTRRHRHCPRSESNRLSPHGTSSLRRRDTLEARAADRLARSRAAQRTVSSSSTRGCSRSVRPVVSPAGCSTTAMTRADMKRPDRTTVPERVSSLT
jgi:hypothetical protein